VTVGADLKVRPYDTVGRYSATDGREEFSMHRLPAFLLLTLIAATPLLAQVQSRPTDLPLLTAENESWYVNGEPIQFAGDLYYPAGATVSARLHFRFG
jgi:hypothetical protein